MNSRLIFFSQNIFRNLQKVATLKVFLITAKLRYLLTWETIFTKRTSWVKKIGNCNQTLAEWFFGGSLQKLCPAIVSPLANHLANTKKKNELEIKKEYSSCV